MEHKLAYLDNAATTRVCPAAIQAATRLMKECYGNPSSLHTMGVASSRELSKAREEVALALGCQSESVYFTSGGTESNNLAIFGGTQAKIRRGKKLIVTSAEHSSVEGAAKRLEETGWEVTYISPDSTGLVDAQAVADAVDEHTALVSMMYVNNETGAIFPIERAAKLIRAKNPETLIHCDGVQAFGKLPFRVSKMEIDLMSVSGHKICGPKGVGALYIRRGVRILPLVYGGSQEKGIRSGTESLPMIAAFAAACRELKVADDFEKIQKLHDYLVEKLEEIPGVCINSPKNSSPYILNISVPGYRSEIMLHFLESRGVYVSSGSACSKGALSHVLRSMGLSPSLVDSALRISLIYDTRTKQLDQLIKGLKEGMEQLAH